MSNRFHNKFHRHNHHTSPTDRETKYPDSAYDPIASRDYPFQGEFFSADNITTQESLCAYGNVYAYDGQIRNNLEVLGDVNFEGHYTQINSLLHVTSAVDITSGDLENPAVSILNLVNHNALKLTNLGLADAVNIRNLNNATALVVANSGSGGGLFLTNEGLGKGFYLENQGAEQALTIVNNSADHAVTVYNEGSGGAVYIQNEGLQSALNIINDGYGTSLYLEQSQEVDVVDYNALGDSVLYIHGSADKLGYTGLGTNKPNEKLTVIGSISSTGRLYEAEKSSIDWNSSYTTLQVTSSYWESAYSTMRQNSASLVLIQSIGCEGFWTVAQLLSTRTFTINSEASSASLSGSFYVMTTASVGADLIVKGNTFLEQDVDINGELSFGSFKTAIINISSSSINTLVLPSNANNIILSGYDIADRDVNITEVVSAKEGSFYIITNSNPGDVVFVQGTDINIRGDSAGLMIKTGESCCLKGKADEKVSVW